MSATQVKMRTPTRSAGPSRMGPLLQDSSLLLATTVLMAAAGGVFWVLAARLQDPKAVGIAGSLISAVVVLSLFAQLGLKEALIRSLPDSTDPATDIGTALLTTGSVGCALGVGYAAVVPLISSDFAVLHDSVWHVLGFGLLVGGTAANVTTDAAFLSLRKVGWNLVVNGLVMSLPKLLLPWALVGWGAFGLAVSVGSASLIAAALSATLLFRQVGRPRTARPSSALRRSVRFALASYAGSLLDIGPTMLVPLILIGAVGPGAAAIYFIAFQIISLLNAGTYAVGGSMFAQAARQPDHQGVILRHGALVLAGAVTSGVMAVVIMAPRLLTVFGDHYADNGTLTLQVMAIGGLGLALGYWSLIRMRLEGRLSLLIQCSAVTNTLVVGLAMLVADRGPTWVAGAWATAQIVGGLHAWGRSSRAPFTPRHAARRVR